MKAPGDIGEGDLVLIPGDARLYRVEHVRRGGKHAFTLRLTSPHGDRKGVPYWKVRKVPRPEVK